MSISIQGAVPSGTILTDDPVLMAGADAGAVVRTLLTDGSGRAMVVGATAQGSAVAGNPVLGGIYDGTNIQYLRTAPINGNSLANGVATAPLAVCSFIVDSASVWQQITSARNNTDNIAGATIQGAVQFVANGISNPNFDKVRNNVDVSLLASAIRTASVTGADITTYNLGGIVVVLDVTSGSGTLNIVINGKDPASGKYYPLLTGTGVTSTSTNIYRIWPSATPSAGLVANDRLPRVINIVVNAANANLVQYSVGYTLLVT